MFRELLLLEVFPLSFTIEYVENLWVTFDSIDQALKNCVLLRFCFSHLIYLL